VWWIICGNHAVGLGPAAQIRLAERFGTSVAVLVSLVKFVLLLPFVIVLPVLTCAAETDPFAAYHDAIERKLAMISNQTIATPAREPSRAIAPQQADTSGAIDVFARQYWNGRETELRVAMSRLHRYRPALESILDREGLPRSLVAVVLVESGAQPHALSPKGARGLWQFMPATATQYGLAVTPKTDERVDVELATRAAARYLRDLFTKFGDWELALAAYNAGPDAVDRALQRGRASKYSEISAARLLPEETRKYVPAVLSAMELTGMKPIVNPARGPQVQSGRVLYAPSGVSD
jgi:soluble lytic murein transglycosylase-like protein